jgi:hypothetical protein
MQVIVWIALIKIPMFCFATAQVKPEQIFLTSNVEVRIVMSKKMKIKTWIINPKFKRFYKNRGWILNKYGNYQNKHKEELPHLHLWTRGESFHSDSPIRRQTFFSGQMWTLEHQGSHIVSLADWSAFLLKPMSNYLVNITIQKKTLKIKSHKTCLQYFHFCWREPYANLQPHWQEHPHPGTELYKKLIH